MSEEGWFNPKLTALIDDEYIATCSVCRSKYVWKYRFEVTIREPLIGSEQFCICPTCHGKWKQNNYGL